jgi:hypothetical protein
MQLKVSKMKIYKQLRELQAELKAPKNQRNNFGKYNYRSAEDILEALKPLAAKHGLTFMITDLIEWVGERYYVRAEVEVWNDEGESLRSAAYAREEENKKGMDGSQVTGAASSYARKYALNGLLLIDDTKDADATNTHDSKPSTTSAPKQAAKSEDNIMDKAVAYIKSQTDKQKAYDAIEAKYGDQLTDKQKAGLKKFVR